MDIALIALFLFTSFVLLILFVNLKRMLIIKKHAGKLGFTFKATATDDFMSALSKNFSFFRGDEDITSVLSGTFNKVDITVFDMTSAGSGAVGRRQFQQTVVLFRSDKLNLPKFAIIPNVSLSPFGAFNLDSKKVISRFDRHYLPSSFQIINIDIEETFSKRYLIIGKNRDDILNVLDKSILSFLEMKAENVFLEGNDNLLIYYELGVLAVPKTLNSFLDDRLIIFEMFKVSCNKM